jgi:hypothetical protein
MSFRITGLALALALAPGAALLAGTGTYTLTIKDHRFTPRELAVPSGERVKLLVNNQDPTAEEFESYALNREKVVLGEKQATVYIGPLDPGRYPFFGEFHLETAKGVIVAQ